MVTSAIHCHCFKLLSTGLQVKWFVFISIARSFEKVYICSEVRAAIQNEFIPYFSSLFYWGSWQDSNKVRQFVFMNLNKFINPSSLSINRYEILLNFEFESIRFYWPKCVIVINIKMIFKIFIQYLLLYISSFFM